MVFPSYVALGADINNIKSTLYLTYNPNSGLLEFNRYAEVPSLIAKFVVEERAGDNLVHIRSCYKNKYLCRESGSSKIVAVANKPEDNCTLFKARWFGSEVEFTHVKSGLGLSYTYIYYNNSSWNLCLGQGKSLRLKVVDFGSLVRLPKRVIFKGDNGKYLRGQWRKPRPINPVRTVRTVSPVLGFLAQVTAPPLAIAMTQVGEVAQNAIAKECEFNEFTAINGDYRSSHYEITHYNGFVRIKSLHFGKFLRASKDAGKIYGDEDDTTLNVVETLFKVNFLGSNNAINLLNLGNNKVCRRMSTFQVDDCLFASESYGVPESKLVVEEPVSYRKIYVRYRLEDARIISERFVPTINKRYSNYSKDRDDVNKFSFKYQKSRTTTWNTSTTITDGIKAEINVAIPKVGVGASIELSRQYAQQESFSKGFTFSEEANSEQQITVPPMNTAIVQGYVREVTFDIPFSYFQTVVYTTGEQEANEAEDGVCHGVETCDHLEKRYERL